MEDTIQFCNDEQIDLLIHKKSRTQITNDIIFNDDTILHIPNKITIWNFNYIIDPWISNEFIHSAINKN